MSFLYDRLEVMDLEDNLNVHCGEDVPVNDVVRDKNRGSSIPQPKGITHRHPNLGSDVRRTQSVSSLYRHQPSEQ